MSYSFVIYKGGKHKKDGSAPWVEYTYNPKEHSADEIVRSITEAEDVVMQDKLKVGDYEVIDYARPRGTTGKDLAAVREIRFEPEADGYVSAIS